MTAPEQQLSGRVAVVTGASRGLGLELARLLGRHGATVVLGARSGEAVDAAVQRLRAEGVRAWRPCATRRSPTASSTSG